MLVPHLRFDILMDIGGFRDMHRHRRAHRSSRDSRPTRLRDAALAGDGAELLAEAGMARGLPGRDRMPRTRRSARIAAGTAPEAALSALYVLPLATRVRCLFKMDFAEAQYISELRSAPAGHFSYRRVAWEMYLALQRQHPSLAKYVRVTDFTKPIDLLQR